MSYTLLFVILLVTSLVHGAPGHFNYQGRLFNTHGEPLNDGVVSLKIQVRDPSAQCLLIEETREVTMTGSDGHFSVIVGLGARTSDSPAFSYQMAFDNSVVLADPKMLCPGNSYTPGLSDARVLRVFVDEEQLIPDHIVNSSPYSLHSEKVGGKSLSDIETDYQVYADENLAGSPLPDLQTTPLTAGDSFRWDGSKWITFQPAPADLPTNSVTLEDVAFASNEGLNVPQLASDPGTPATGQMYFNTTTNQMMVYNGSSWVSAGASGSPWALSGSDVSFASGNVGIGTTSPTLAGTGLHVNGSSSAGTQLRLTNTDSNSNIWEVQASGSSNGAGAGNFAILQPGTAYRMVIDGTSGNVGIGTTNPNRKFEVSDGEILSAGSTAGLHVERFHDTAGWGGGFHGKKARGTQASPAAVQANDVLSGLYGAGYDGTANSAYTGAIRVLANESFSAGNHGSYIDFATTEDGGTSRSTRMVISSEGNVGIGTTSPGAPLNIGGYLRFGDGGGSWAAGPDILMTGSGVIGAEQSLFINIDTDNDTTSGSLTIGANAGTSAATPLVRIQENGNVGIGTATPSSLLDVSSGASGDAVLKIEADTDNNNEEDNPKIELLQDGGAVSAEFGIIGNAGNVFTGSISNAAYVSSDLAGTANTDLQFAAGGAARVTIQDDTGNVGIGTISPSEKLHVAGTILSNLFDLDMERVTATSTSDSTFSVTCPAGKKVISGGCNCTGASHVEASYPRTALDGWSCNCNDAVATYTAYAVCAKVR